MKALYIGGQKSGKSVLAEQKSLTVSADNVFYIATYDISFNDKEMQARIDKHIQRRGSRFKTIEETINIDQVIKANYTYLVDCLSLWLLNVMQNKVDYLQILDNCFHTDANIIFVLNDIGSGVIPEGSFSRQYIDQSGIISQIVAKQCDEVYHVIAGIENRIK